MLKKTMKYVDYNGTERTEDFYFHLSNAEILELEAGINGGLSTLLNRIIAAQDTKSIVEIFKKIVLLAYGEKSLDGRKFVKSKEITDGFEQTPAYSDLFIELATNAEAATAFVKGIIPSEIQK